MRVIKHSNRETVNLLTLTRQCVGLCELVSAGFKASTIGVDVSAGRSLSEMILKNVSSRRDKSWSDF